MNNYITRKIFMWIIGIMITVWLSVAGYLAGRMDALEKKYNHNFTEIRQDISSIKTDISWIKQAIIK